MNRPARTDIDPEYRFDPSTIYETPADWEDAYEELLNRLDDLESLTDESNTSTDDIEQLLDHVTDCFRRRQRLELYAMLAGYIATESDEAADRRRRARDLAETFEPVVNGVLRQFAGLSATEIAQLPDEYQRYTRNLKAQGSYVCSQAVEETIRAFEQPRTASSRIFRAVKNEDFEPPTVERPDRETVEITHSSYGSELTHDDREYRREVDEAYHEKRDRFEHTLVRAYAEKLQAAHAEASIRGYDSIRDRALHQRCYPESGLSVSLSEEVHDVMLDAVRNNLGPYHEALERRREYLGVDQLRPWDLQVPLTDADPPGMAYDETRDHILAALEPLGEEYVEQARSFFAERRIDVFPTANKRSDIRATCPSSADDGAFILANYQDDVRTAFDICHELGHAIHVEHLRNEPTQYAAAPRPVEEIPSLLHELLLADHLVEEDGALAEIASNRLLTNLGGNIYGATRSSAFTHAVAQQIEDGQELTVERVHELGESLREAFLAPVEFGDGGGRTLPVNGIRAPYCYYQYVFGATGALVVRERLRNGDLSPAQYRDFLVSTGREQSVDLFERLGYDVRTPDPVETAADAFAEYVAEL